MKIRNYDSHKNHIFDNEPSCYLKALKKKQKNALDQNFYIPCLRNEFSKIFENLLNPKVEAGDIFKLVGCKMFTRQLLKLE